MTFSELLLWIHKRWHGKVHARRVPDQPGRLAVLIDRELRDEADAIAAEIDRMAENVR